MRYKIIECEQGSDEWFRARMGKITASVFDKVVTSTGKASASIDEVVNIAVAELILERPQEELFKSYAMIRGQELEEGALETYNFLTESNFQKCGFLDVVDENGKSLGWGCSPDGIDEKRGRGLELKSPLAHTHIAYLVARGLPKKYFQQVQFSLMATGFDAWDFGSIHPELPALPIEVGRDEKFIKLATPILEDCLGLIQERLFEMQKIVGETRNIA